MRLHQADFLHSALIEWNPHAVKTLKLNCQDQLGIADMTIHHIDARDFDPTPYESKVELLAGGPPCQPFSTGGKNLAHLDQRDMFSHFLDAMKVVRPKAILIENVRELLRPRFEDYFQYILLRIMFPYAVSGSRPFKEELSHLKKLSSRFSNIEHIQN